MAQQMKVKPTTAPVLPTQYTYTGADGSSQTAHFGRGIAGKEFDARVNEHGDQWVMVNGIVTLGGVGPSGLPLAARSDGYGNLGAALPSAAVGSAPLNSTSVAYEASRFVKNGSGVLLGLSGYNSKTATQFVLILDYGDPRVPANGTVPFAIIAVAASSNFSYDPGRFGRAFTAGLWVANSSTGPSLTIGSADVWVDVQFV